MTLPWSMIQAWAAPLLIAAFVFIFYLPPVVSPNASIHWDAADVHYPMQRYFAERIRTGIPFWTPYVYSGYPILANPEMQAWYPPNWPFYVLGFRPGSVEAELALHAFLACLGAYLFILRLGVRSSAAMLGGLAYGLSGFFAGHSSHVPVFLSAAWFPWLLWAYRRAAESPGLANIAGGALAGGAMILAGYYQVAILAFLGLACYASADVWRGRARALGICAGMLVGALALSVIQFLPAVELIAHSAPDPPAGSGEVLRIRSLATLVFPDASGGISGKDQGMVTDHYLYAGLALLPLAVAGALKGRHRRPALAVFGIALWYMLGPYAGLYWLGTLIPGRLMAGPAGLAWFLAAMALACLAAMGSDRLFRRVPLAGIVLVGVLFVDLWYWNLLRNPLAYERNSFETLYGRAERTAAQMLAVPLLPLTRFDAPSAPRGAGPLLHALDLKLETTYGYFVLQPKAYREYCTVMRRNAKLRDGLNVSCYLSISTRQLEANPTALPRAYFPRAVTDVATEAGSLKALETIDPSAQSSILGPHATLDQDRSGTPFVANYDEQSYHVNYTASSPSLLKLSVPWYPGWRVRIDGLPLAVLRVDHALMGVVAPAGEHEAEFRFRSNWFRAGLAISVLALVSLCVLVFSLHSFVWARIRMKQL